MVFPKHFELFGAVKSSMWQEMKTEEQSADRER